MFKRIFGASSSTSSTSKPAGGTSGGTGPSKEHIQLQETLGMLEKREGVIEKNIAAEIAKARQFSNQKNKKAALQCLKKKKLYEDQLNNNQNQKMRLMEQLMMIEDAKSTTETMRAMSAGAAQIKKMTKEANIKQADATMDDIAEANDELRALQDALSQPLGSSADIDEDDLEAELDGLMEEDLDDVLGELPAAPSGVSASALPSVPAAPAAVAAVPAAEDDELAALQREMEALEAA